MGSFLRSMQCMFDHYWFSSHTSVNTCNLGESPDRIILEDGYTVPSLAPAEQNKN